MRTISILASLASLALSFTAAACVDTPDDAPVVVDHQGQLPLRDGAAYHLDFTAVSPDQVTIAGDGITIPLTDVMQNVPADAGGLTAADITLTAEAGGWRVHVDNITSIFRPRCGLEVVAWLEWVYLDASGYPHTVWLPVHEWVCGEYI